jgi:Na+/H+-dicarboxylate symporter
LKCKGIAGLGTSRAGKIAGRSLLYYFATTILAVVLGLILVTTIKPGKVNKPIVDENAKDPLGDERIQTVDTILDLIRNLFPDNMVEMVIRHLTRTIKFV